MISGNIFQGLLFPVGPVGISGSIVIVFGLSLLLGLVAFISSRRLNNHAGAWQTFLEGSYSAAHEAIHDVVGEHTETVMPFITSLWVFILCANLLGIIPGLGSPTSDLSITAALAVLVFLSVHWFGIRIEGLRSYLRHYASPSFFLLPFHLISEISRTVALAVRLFGNIMSLEMAAILVLYVAGLLVPIPLLMLHIVEAVIQAYLFGMLALIYIAGGLQTQELRRNKRR